MRFPQSLRRQAALLLAIALLTLPTLATAASLGDLFGKKEIDESERKETIERIQSIQEKLKLLQDKLRVLERRKAAKEAAERAETAESKIPQAPVQVNWQPVDETTTDPGDYGLYTYLLFQGDLEDTTAIGYLEDFILTIETLPEREVPAGLGNQFLVPVEKPQSLIRLGRQPYDFKLNEAYLRRLGLHGELPDGPVLVSLAAPLDPYGGDAVPAYLAVAFGHQLPERAAQLAEIWHRQEKDAVTATAHPGAELFWQLIDGDGVVQVSRNRQRITATLPQP